MLKTLTATKVLFGCSGTAFRSPVVEARLRMFKPEIEGDSVGPNPVTPISESAREYLEKETRLKNEPLPCYFQGSLVSDVSQDREQVIRVYTVRPTEES